MQWGALHRMIRVLEKRQRNLKLSANPLHYTKNNEQMTAQRAQYYTLKSKINGWVKQKGRVTRVRNEIEKIEDLMDNFEDHLTKRFSLFPTIIYQKLRNGIAN